MSLPRDRHRTLYAVIGDDVSRSRSPAVHNAAFAATGRAAHLFAFSTADPLAVVAEAARARYGGLAITRPHKSTVLAAVTELTPEAMGVGAVNTIAFRDERVIGTNTDVFGIRQALAEAGVSLVGRKVVIVGAGGTARAAVAACRLDGAGAVCLLARRPEQAAALAADRELIGALPCEAADLFSDRGRECLTAAEVLIQTTPVGSFDQRGATPFDPALLPFGVAVLDVGYDPAMTMLLQAARERGGVAVGGGRMFVHQAAAQFAWWTGIPAPLEVMMEALGEV